MTIPFNIPFLDKDATPKEIFDWSGKLKQALEATLAQITTTNLGGSTLGKQLFAITSAAAARGVLGLVIGTDVQAFNADLLALADLGSAVANAGKVPMIGNAGGWALSGLPVMDDRIINGAMRIDQRRVGAAVTPTSSAYLVDRWQLGLTQASKLTCQQLAPSPALAGFSHALKVTVASNYSTLAGDTFFLKHAIEGNNVADLDFGLASAKPVVVSFWVQSSVTGTYSAALRNNNGTRTYLGTFSIPVANTWTYITLPIAGDTTGTWLKDTSTGIELDIDLGSGSTFLSTAGSWQAGNFIGVTGAVNFVAHAAATFWLTGVRLQPGTIATPYFLRSWGDEFTLCQRYYQKSYAYATPPGTVTGSTNGTLIGYTSASNSVWLSGVLPTPMRAFPSATAYSYATGAAGNFRNDSLGVDAATSGITGSENSVMQLCIGTANFQQCQGLHTLDAEL